MQQYFQGTVHKFPDNVNTDVIIPARYLNKFDDATLAQHCMEDISPDFSNQVKPGDIIVAGENFGCGSSREHAPLALKASGICCVIAVSFARIFYRNCINIGLPLIELGNDARKISDRDLLKISLVEGKIEDVTASLELYTPPVPEFIRDIIDRGGLLKLL